MHGGVNPYRKKQTICVPEVYTKNWAALKHGCCSTKQRIDFGNQIIVELWSNYGRESVPPR